MINPFDEKDYLVSQVFPTKRRAQTALDKSLRQDRRYERLLDGKMLDDHIIKFVSRIKGKITPKDYYLVSKGGNMIEFYLSSDGNTVHLSAESAEELNRLSGGLDRFTKGSLPATATNRRCGRRRECRQTRQPAGDCTSASRSGGPPVAPQAPICPVHGQPMRLRQGRRGSFWSCSARDEWGQWCRETKNAVSTAS